MYTFGFLKRPEQQWFLVAVLVILSLLTFERFATLRPYHNQRISQLQLLFRALAVWSTFSLFIAKLLQPSLFNGGLELWLLGIPLVLGMVFFKRETHLKILLQGLANFSQGEDITYQIDCLLAVIRVKETTGDRNAEIALKGYIYTHEETCPNIQCHLKQYKRNMIQLNIIKNRRRAGMGTQNIV